MCLNTEMFTHLLDQRRITPRPFVLNFVILLIGLSFAQGQEPVLSFGYADLFNLRSAQTALISPDGTKIAFMISSYDRQQDSEVQDLWVLRIADKQTTQISVLRAGAAAWSADGQTLAVVGEAANGGSTISLVRADDLRVIRAFPVASPPGELIWSPDGTSLAFTLTVPEKVSPSDIQKAVDAAQTALTKPAGVNWAPPVQLTQMARYRQDGGRWLKPSHSHIFVLSTNGGTIRQIGFEAFDDHEPAWTADSKSVLFTSDRRSVAGNSTTVSAIYTTELATGVVAELTDTNGAYSAPRASPDGRWIAFTAYQLHQVNYTRTDLYVMHPDGSAIQRLAPVLDRDIFGYQWASDSKGVYALYADHGIERLGLMSLNGSAKEVASGLDSGWSVSQGGDIAYTASTQSEPNEVELQHPGHQPVVVTSLNSFLRQRRLGRLIHLEAYSPTDKLPIEGWALLPSGTSDHSRVPTILSLHGGPFGWDGPNWSRTNQLFAAAGYAVVYVNYRGSISYGTAFSEPANYAFPGVAYEGLMSVVDEAIRQGFADPERLFITGGSAGGELTSWTIGQTKRFRAAVAEKPVIDALTQSLTTDQYLNAVALSETPPWLAQEEMWANSPLSLAGSITTPTLFIVGEDDYRTSVDQTLEMYGALQLQNIPTALMRVPGAGHESLGSRPSQLAAEIAATLAWFHHYDRPTTD